jgi:hypothetical protein
MIGSARTPKIVAPGFTRSREIRIPNTLSFGSTIRMDRYEVLRYYLQVLETQERDQVQATWLLVALYKWTSLES